ncbi:MAG: hypothetical protein ACKVQC_05505, partial [Elusimicrobiota bacterium]
MKKNVSYFLRGFLALVFLFTQVLFSHAIETSIWKERRKNVVSANLQPSFLSKKEILLPRFSLVPAASKAPHLSLPIEYQDLIADLEKNGLVRDVKLGEGSPLVICIQDVHGHSEAQKNIAQMVLSVLARHPKAVIGLEGASGRIPIESFRKSTQEINQEIGSFFLNTGLITGAEYAGFSASIVPHLVGIENEALYLKNVEAIRSALAYQKDAHTIFIEQTKKQEEQKLFIYSPRLLKLDEHRTRYLRGEESLGNYLSSLAAENSSSLNKFPTVNLFLKTLALEKKLHFDRAEEERNLFLSRLMRVLTKEQQGDLSAHSLALRAGKIHYPDFYAFLKTLSSQTGTSLLKMPEFNRYITYTLQANTIRPETLFSEIPKFEDHVWLKLCRNNRERQVYQESVATALNEKLLKLTLTSEEWDRLKKQVIGRPSVLVPFAEFYDAAEARNAALASYFETARTNSSEKVAVLVAGGFHTAGLRPLINKEATIITVSPKLKATNVSPDHAYLNIFTREKTPLEKMFEAPKISIVMTLAVHPIRDTAGRALNAMSSVISALIGP